MVLSEVGKMIKDTICKIEGQCFAKRDGRCEILMITPEEGCSFQKPVREVTNGKYYAYNPASCGTGPEKNKVKKYEEKWEND